MTSRVVDITGSKEMCSISAIYSNVLRFIVVDYSGRLLYRTRQGLIVVDLTRYKHFRLEKYMFGCMIASGWIIWLRLYNAFQCSHGLKRAHRKTGTE